MINTTLNEITPACFDWCKLQHFAHDYQNVWILGIIFFALSAYLFFYLNAERFIKHAENPIVIENHIDTIQILCILLSYILLIAFLALWKFF